MATRYNNDTLFDEDLPQHWGNYDPVRNSGGPFNPNNQNRAPDDIRYPGAPVGDGATPPPPPTTTTAGPDWGKMGGFSNDFWSWFDQQTAGKGATTDTLRALQPDLQKAGYELVFDAAGKEADTLRYQGRDMDVIRDVGGAAAAWQRHDPRTNAASVGRAGQGGALSVNPASSYLSQLPTTPSGVTMPEAKPRDPRWDAMYDELLRRSQQSLNVSPDDPVIKAQSDAFRARAGRDRLLQLQEAAERGGPYATGAIGGEARRSGERMAVQSGEFLSRLMGEELQARRAEIRDALSSRQGMLSAAEVSRLREQDQELARKQVEIGFGQQGFENEMNRFITSRNAQAQDFDQFFRDRDWNADLAQENWENDYQTLFG